MQNLLSWILLPILGALTYAIGYEFIKPFVVNISEKLTNKIFKKRGINLSGKWYATWQTTIDNTLNINTELVMITQKGIKMIIENENISPQNKIGGYYWLAKCTIYDNNHILGYYLARDTNITSKGTIYFVLSPSGESLKGIWAGCNYDADFNWGYGVIAKDYEFSIRELDRLIKNDIHLKLLVERKES